MAVGRRASNALDLVESGAVDLVLNVPKSIEEEELTNDYLIRRHAVDRDVPLLVNAETAALFAEALLRHRLEDLKVRAWDDYVPRTEGVVTDDPERPAPRDNIGSARPRTSSP